LEKVKRGKRRRSSREKRTREEEEEKQSELSSLFSRNFSLRKLLFFHSKK